MPRGAGPLIGHREGIHKAYGGVLGAPQQHSLQYRQAMSVRITKIAVAHPKYRTDPGRACEAGSAWLWLGRKGRLRKTWIAQVLAPSASPTRPAQSARTDRGRPSTEPRTMRLRGIAGEAGEAPDVGRLRIW